MTLKIDQEKLTIMGVPFDSQKGFRFVWYVVSSNMIEGWEPSVEDVKRLRERAISKREDPRRGER